jgi:serine/threonine protein phosphatase 1
MPTPPCDERISYAIGDVHGHCRELQRLILAIRADMATYPAQTRFRVVLIGDLIDRGPDSRGVIDEVIALQREATRSRGRLEVVALRGNHEDTVLSILEGRAARIERWYPDTLGYGGGASFLRSYGAPVVRLEEVPAAVRRWVRPEHVAFLRAMPLYLDTGAYLFVHAGIRPGYALHLQSTFDLVHIRKDFLNFNGDFGRIVVHGHTPHRQPQVRPSLARPNRINVDTGCGYGVLLTCAVLEPHWNPARLRFLSVKNEIECTFVEGLTHEQVKTSGLPARPSGAASSALP